jgi:hypothetical protein
MTQNVGPIPQAEEDPAGEPDAFSGHIIEEIAVFQM